MTETTSVAPYPYPSPASARAHHAIKARSEVLARGAGRLRAAAGALPPSGLILTSMLSVQVGAALAKSLFAALGPGGTVSLRIAIAALVLLAVERPRLRGQTCADYLAVALFGVVIAAMNLAFYAAIARLPLGLAVTVEFVGPLGVAVAGSRRRLDLLWVILAAMGILLLAPIGPSAIDALGVGFALLAGCGWAAYILLNVRVGRAFSGGTGLALSMAVAALAIVPVGAPTAGALRAHPQLLGAGVGVALLSTVIPFSLEHTALKRVPAHVFGVLMSAEPAIAAVIGAVVLGEALGWRGLLALACVVVATAGSARFGRHDDAVNVPTHHELSELVERIRAAPAPAGMATRVIAVDGPGGAGKSTLARHLAAALDAAPIVHTDDFASWEVPLEWWPRLRTQVLEPLARNEPARYQRYDWAARRLAEWHEVPPVPFLILEGVSASREAFCPYLSYTIWVETPRAERLRRGLERDGRAALAHWQEWMAAEDAYIARERPAERADSIISGWMRHDA